MADFILITVLVLIVGSAVRYIRKEKKRGAVCIGCPQAGTCAKKHCSGSAENTKHIHKK